MESRLLNLKRNEEKNHSEIKQNSNKKSKFQIIYDQKLVIRVIIITYCGKGVIQNCQSQSSHLSFPLDHNTVGIRVIKNHLLPITVVMFENFTFTMSTKMLFDSISNTVGKGVIKNNLLPVTLIAFEHFSLLMCTKMLFEI